tara:strand:+ start:24706 stop:26631 length:1926 start_codon:yes stop_codon:yes gene_type:complete
MFIKIKVLFIIVTLICIGCKKEPSFINQNISNNDSIQHYYLLSKNKSENSKIRLNAITTSYELAKKANNDSLILKTLTYKSQRHSIEKQFDSALIFSKKLLNISKILKDSASMGNAYFKLGLYHDKSNKNDSAFYYYNQSKNIYAALLDSVEVGKRLLNMAIIQSDKGDYMGSDDTAVQALTYLNHSKDNETLASVHNCLAITARKLEQYNDAIFRYDQAINLTPSAEDKLLYLSNKANVYVDQSAYNKAIGLYDSITNLKAASKDEKLKARLLDNSTYAKWKQTGTQNYAEPFETALQSRIEINDWFGQIASNAHLMEYYQASDIRKAKSYALEMYRAASKVNSADDRLEALKQLVVLEDNPEKSTIYSHRFIKLNDSILKERTTAKNQFVKVKYENEKNREANFQLKTENIQKKLELEKTNRFKTIYFFAGLLILVSSFFIFWYNKLQHKKEKMQQVYKTEAHISKKVHDEIANDFYQVMSKLQTENNPNTEVLDQLETIYLKTRDISKNISPIDTNVNFQDQLKDLFMSYKNVDTNIISRNTSKINWDGLPHLKKITLYRVLQELLTNMKKHSKASYVILTFQSYKNGVMVQYQDNGIGCNLKKSNGLQSTENRMDSINGTIIFESEIHKGFKAKIIL